MLSDLIGQTSFVFGCSDCWCDGDIVCNIIVVSIFLINSDLGGIHFLRVLVKLLNALCLCFRVDGVDFTEGGEGFACRRASVYH